MVRRHPDTGWRTGDFVRRWPDTYGNDIVYRVDGVLRNSTRVTLVACCARGTDTTSHPLDLAHPIEEDIPTDEREAAILALEMDGYDEGICVGESRALIADPAHALAEQA